MYLSDAYAGPQGQPSHLGSPWQGLQADTWATLTSEGYLDLAPGTYTYYVLIYNATSGTLAVANSATDGAAYCTVIAWPL